jgi:uncharacterized BrkB/YihY/UPF0761 family membrane protein
VTGLPEGGRLTRLRTRADRAADQYQQLAQRRPLLGLPLVFIARYTARQGLLLASACAFRMFLWLMPLALLLAGVLAGVAGSASSIESASKAAGVTGTASHQIAMALHAGHKSWWVAVVIGAALFLWTTRTLLRSLALVNAHVWEAPPPKLQQKDVLLTTLVFAGGWLVIIIAAVLTVRLDRLIPAGLLLTVVVQTAAVAAVWMVICLRLPDRRTSWVDLLPGCVLFGFGLAVLHAVSRIYIPRRVQHSSELYGNLGVAAVILTWLLLFGQLVVAAALSNAVWSEYRTGGRRTAAATSAQS